MKTEYKYINFGKVPSRTDKDVWACANNKSGVLLGMIEWDPYWKKYCLEPTLGSRFDSSCLKDIAGFIDQLTEDSFESAEIPVKPKFDQEE